MKVTISDVAKLAGVSTATVSHTINATRYVSSETKDKVYRAIQELGYTPDASPPGASAPARKRPSDLLHRIFPTSFSAR